jgi:xylan 1,4-beta-xylosidase
MALYNSSAHAIKAVHPSLKVGGPATAGLDKITDFVDACKAGNIPYDFVSSHHYPTDGKNGGGPPACPHGADWDPTCFSTQVKAARNLVANDAFYLTEYNVGCCLGKLRLAKN